jgi:outer membrane protein OmpA-like peptidoglycan-associated protein
MSLLNRSTSAPAPERRSRRSHRSALTALLATGAVIISGLFATAAHADPITYETYQFSGVTFVDGGTATGWFEISSTGLINDFSISVAGGDTITYPALTYSPANNFQGNQESATLVTFMEQSPGFRMLNLGGAGLIGPASNHTVTLDTNASYECYNCAPYRNVATGALVGAPTVRGNLTTTTSNTQTLSWADPIPLAIDWAGTSKPTEYTTVSVAGHSTIAYYRHTNTNGSWNYTNDYFGPVLAPGNYPVSASYPGDALQNPITTNVGTVTVTKASITPDLSAGAATGPHSPITLTAQLQLAGYQGPAATGNVTFKAGSTAVGVAPLDSTGTATLTTANLPAGYNQVTAVYAGDTYYAAKTSSPRSVYAIPATPVVTQPSAPRQLHAAPGDRQLVVSFRAPANSGGSPITSYRISLDGGRTFSKAAVSGAAGGLRKITLPGLRNGASYRVVLAAVNHQGVGARSAVVTAKLKQWFADDLTAAKRRSLIAAPAVPAKYRGALRATRAYHRSHNGAVAIDVSRLRGRQLQTGQAVSLGSGTVFSFDGSSLSASGRAAVRKLAASVRYAGAVTCEGYSDYGNKITHQQALSVARARTVCAELVRDGARVRTASVGFGGNSPAVVGGHPADRAANRRVVVLVTR